MQGLRVLGLIGLVFTGSTFADVATPPSATDIQTWWSKQSSEKLMLQESPVAVHLTNGELAYLQSAMFGGARSRNAMFGMVIVRPAQQQARETPFWLGQKTQVLDLDQDGVSEVATSRIESGGGSAYGHRSLVQFDGWNALLLHQSEFDSNEGVWGTRSHRYRAKELDWQFHDLDGDGLVDLLETITHKLGRNQRQPLISTARQAFALKHGHLVRLREPRVVPSTAPAAQ